MEEVLEAVEDSFNMTDAKRRLCDTCHSEVAVTLRRFNSLIGLRFDLIIVNYHLSN